MSDLTTHLSSATSSQSGISATLELLRTAYNAKIVKNSTLQNAFEISRNKVTSIMRGKESIAGTGLALFCKRYDSLSVEVAQRAIFRLEEIYSNEKKRFPYKLLGHTVLKIEKVLSNDKIEVIFKKKQSTL